MNQELQYVRVNIDLEGPHDIWRIDYEVGEARYLESGTNDNEEIIEYDGFIGDYLEEKGFRITKAKTNEMVYRFEKVENNQS